MRTRSAGRLAVALGFALGIACGGSSGSGSGQSGGEERVAAAVQVVSGNLQSAVVGSELPAPLVVRVVDAGGLPVKGQFVSFRVAAGSGSVLGGAALTGADGIARDRWTLGTTAGPQRLEARALDQDTGAPLVFATFDATALAGPAVAVVVAGGSGQTAPQLTRLPTALKARVTDAFANPVPGATVAFAARGGGSVAPASASTDPSGVATAEWTLGAALGTQWVDAWVSGLPSVAFSATSTAGPPQVTLSAVSGGGQSGMLGKTLAEPLVVKLLTLEGAPVAGQLVSFEVKAGGGAVQATALTGLDGTAQTAWQLGTVLTAQQAAATATDPISGNDVGPVTFEATPLTSATVIVPGDLTIPGLGLPYPTGPMPVTAVVRDAYGNGVPGVEVAFVTTLGSGHASPALETSSFDGSLATTWMNGLLAGAQTLTLSTPGVPPVAIGRTVACVFDGWYDGSATVTGGPGACGAWYGFWVAACKPELIAVHNGTIPADGHLVWAHVAPDAAVDADLTFAASEAGEASATGRVTKAFFTGTTCTYDVSLSRSFPAGWEGLRQVLRERPPALGP